MAEKETKQDNKPQKAAKPEAEKKKARPEEVQYDSLVRINGYDIPGSRGLYVGLTRIKGVSWAVANFLILKLGMKHETKVSSLSKDDIKKIEDFLANIDMPDFMKNRRSDIETGETSHIIGNALDIRKDFDIKRMKKMKSYKGVRHSSKLPVRGQRTKSHFREKGRSAAGVRKKTTA